MYQIVNADELVPMNGLRLSASASQPSLRTTLPLMLGDGRGLELAASADVNPQRQPTERSSVTAASPARRHDLHMLLTTASLLDESPRSASGPPPAERRPTRRRQPILTACAHFASSVRRGQPTDLLAKRLGALYRGAGNEEQGALPARPVPTDNGSGFHGVWFYALTCDEIRSAAVSRG